MSTHASSRIPFWQRLLITVGAMLLVSFIVGMLWRGFFNAGMPPYLAGLIGGLTALPVWEFLKRVTPKA